MVNKTPQWTAKKYLGQHFLVAEKIKAAIIASCPSAADLILEIGPGAGAITDLLPALQKPIRAIEIDERFIPHLQELLGPENVLAQDALKVDYSSLLKDFQAPWIVSNMPYNIAAPLMRILLEQTKVAGITLMMQKEMADKILLPKKNGMNSLGILWHSFWQIEKICAVDPACFRPRPKVDSTVLFFTPKADPLLPLAQILSWENFLRQLFAFKRKQLSTVLSKMRNGLSKEQITQLLTDLKLDPHVRAEALTIEQIKDLYQAWPKSL